MDDTRFAPRPSVILVAIEEYKKKATYPTLKEAKKTARDLANILTKGGYRHVYPNLLEGGSAASVNRALTQWAQGSTQRDTILFYWAGHAKSDSDGHFLITKDSPATCLAGFNAIKASDLGSIIAKSKAEKALIVLDTCYSGMGAKDVAGAIAAVLATRPEQPGRCPAFAIIASVHPLKKAQEGLFSRVLAQLLDSPPALECGWTDNDRYINPADIAGAIANKLEDACPFFLALGYDQCFVPNPRFRGELHAQDIETRQHLVAEDHILPVAPSIELGEGGWYFVGRRHLLNELVNWLRSATHGLVVVTGSPGSGKSAVMGRIVTLSDPGLRAAAERAGALAVEEDGTVPPQAIVDVALHLKGKTLLDCVSELVGVLHIRVAEPHGNSLDVLLDALAGHRQRVTLLFDGLDEAAPGESESIGLRLIRPLSELSQVRVLVATRYNLSGAAMVEEKRGHEQLRKVFGDRVTIYDLDDEPQTAQDIAKYVRLRLVDSRHRNDVAGIERAAKAVATNAKGSFLYARIVCRTLQEVDQLDTGLPADAGKAFIEDLIRRFGEHAKRVNDLLTALAWARGKGMTRAAWPLVATALSHDGQRYQDRDVAWVLAHAGWHIIEAGEDGQAVYRLSHQVIVEQYRELLEPQDASARITEALTGRYRGKDWLNSDRYVRRHLASHAAAARRLDPLVKDPGFLAVADPARLLPELFTLADPKARQIGNVYRLIGHELQAIDPVERMALIHLAAWQEAPELATMLEPAAATAWRCRWAKSRRASPHLVLGRHKYTIMAVDIGEIDGTPLVVSGGEDGSIRLWNARNGTAKGPPLTGHRLVLAVALGKVDGEPVVVSGGAEGADRSFGSVRLWSVRNGAAMGEPLFQDQMPPVAVAVDEIDGAPVVAAANYQVQLCDVRARTWRAIPSSSQSGFITAVLGQVDGVPVVIAGSVQDTIGIWDARTLAQRTVYKCQRGGGFAVTLGEVDGQAVVASAGFDGVVQLWDAKRGAARGKPFTAHPNQVTAVAMGQVDDIPLMVTGGVDRTVRLWNARSGASLGNPLIGHQGAVRSVALGNVDGTPVAVSGSEDGTIRLWNVRDSVTTTEPPIIYPYEFTAVTLGVVDSVAVVVTGEANGTVQLWDACSGAAKGQSLTGHEGFVAGVALGEVDGAPVVASSGKDGTVRLWDARSNTARGQPLHGHDGSVSAVTFGNVDGLPIVASGGKDGTVRLWDARSGAPLGNPLPDHKEPVLAVACGNVDGMPVVASGGCDGPVRLWDARSRKARGTYPGHRGFVHTLALYETACSLVVVSGAEDGTMRLWDGRIGAPGSSSSVNDPPLLWTVGLGEVADVPVVASGKPGQVVQLWDLNSGALRGESLPAPNMDSWFWSAVNLQDGLTFRRKITGSAYVVIPNSSGTYTVKYGEMLFDSAEQFTGYDQFWVESVAVSASGTVPVLVSGGEDGKVRLWEASPPRLLRSVPLRYHIRGVAMGEGSEVVVCTSAGLLVLDFLHVM